jgi:DNA-binding MurR/RpiR family transcriptional regulator
MKTLASQVAETLIDRPAAPTAQGSTVFGSSPIGARLAALLAEGTPGQRKLADFVLRNPVRLPALSIEDLAAAAGVSAPTISRFARELGFGGFAEFRTAAAESVQALLDPVTKLKRQLASDGGPARPELVEASRALVTRLDGERLTAQAARFADALRDARSVQIMGFGLSAHAAALLVLGLQPFCPQVSGVVEFGGTEVAAGRLMAMGPQDLLVAISVPRYASDVVRLTRYGADRGARIIAITDSPASPLVPLAHEVIFAPADHPTLSSSMVAVVAVVETLVATVMLSDPANAERAALLGKALDGYLHTP